MIHLNWSCRAALFFGLALNPLANVCGGELPVLKAFCPGEKRAATSNVAIMGEFSPVFTTNIRVRLYHVLANGLVTPQAGCSFSARESGKYGVTIDAPPGGWIAGRTRVVVSLDNLLQVKQEIEFEAVGEGSIPAGARAIHLPVPSGLVVRLPLEEVKVYDLGPRMTYLVEGNFLPTMEHKVVQGPLLFGECVLIRPDGSRVICDSATGPSFVQADGSCWYQLQMRAPERPGVYQVKLKTVAPDAVKPDAFGADEFPFSIRVSESGNPPKP